MLKLSEFDDEANDVRSHRSTLNTNPWSTKPKLRPKILLDMLRPNSLLLRLLEKYDAKPLF